MEKKRRTDRQVFGIKIIQPTQSPRFSREIIIRRPLEISKNFISAALEPRSAEMK